MVLPSHHFLSYQCLSTVLVYLYALFISRTHSVEISIEGRDTKITYKTLVYKGVETFEKVDTSKPYSNYETNFGNSAFKGVYSDLKLLPHNIPYESTGGYYAVANENTSYQLKIKDGPAKANFFGLWISSFDLDNLLEFNYKGTQVYVLRPTEVYAKIKYDWRRKWSLVFKKWRPAFDPPTKDASVFVNINFKDEQYDEVRFTAKASKFESDNHSVGHWKEYEEPVTTTTPEPEFDPNIPVLYIGAAKPKSSRLVVVGGLILNILVLVMA